MLSIYGAGEINLLEKLDIVHIRLLVTLKHVLGGVKTAQPQILTPRREPLSPH